MESIWNNNTSNATSTEFTIPRYCVAIVAVGEQGGEVFGGGTVYVEVSYDGGTRFGITNKLGDSDVVEVKTYGRSALLRLRLSGSSSPDIDAHITIVPK